MFAALAARDLTQADRLPSGFDVSWSHHLAQMAHILPPGISSCGRSLQGAAYGLGISETARVIASRTASSAWSKRDTNDDGGVTVNDTEGSIAAPACLSWGI